MNMLPATFSPFGCTGALRRRREDSRGPPARGFDGGVAEMRCLDGGRILRGDGRDRGRLLTFVDILQGFSRAVLFAAIRESQEKPSLRFAKANKSQGGALRKAKESQGRGPPEAKESQ